VTEIVLTIKVDDKFLETLQKLKPRLNATNDADVLRLSLALASTAVANADASSNTVTISGESGKSTTVKLDG
jgi:hypothetical protein